MPAPIAPDWQAGRWRLDLDRLFDAVTPRTRGISLNSPSNPVGWTASREELLAIRDFCRKHAAAYVSDPDGALRIRARPGALGLYRQGSAKAQCVYCTHCGVLIGVMYEAVGHRYATVNVRVLDGEPGFADSVVVSPKTLSAAEKVSRWKQLWCRGVEVEER